MSERITVTITPRTRAALEGLVAETGLSQTDVVNRAVQLYAFVDGADRGGARLVVQWPSGDSEVVKFL